MADDGDVGNAQLPNHSLPKNNPIVLLEHINLNVGTKWSWELDEIFFDILGCLSDNRVGNVLGSMQYAGSYATDLRWANLGFQQFHLVCYGDPTCYNDVGEPWSAKQRIHGVIGIEWSPGELSWKLLRERLEMGQEKKIIQNVEEITLEANAEDNTCSTSAFRFTACHGNVFQIEAQRTRERDKSAFFVGPISPAPLVRDVPVPLPCFNPRGYDVDDNGNVHTIRAVSSALGIRYIEYFVPPCESLGSKTPLDVIQETYRAIFPSMIHSRKYSSLSSGKKRTVRDQLQIIVGHVDNAQYLKFTQLLQDDTKDIYPYDGHHVAIYVNDFVESFSRAKRKNIVFENPVFPQFSYKTLEEALGFDEFRFRDFIDEETGTVVFRLEHEVRSLRHQGFSRNKKVWAG